MSETDSFLDEVSEEVKKDRLLAWLNKNSIYIGALLVFIIGGAAVNEYMKHAARSAAEANGDKMVAALEAEETADSVKALDALQDDASDSAPLLLFQLAAAHEVDGDTEAAIETLRKVIVNKSGSDAYKDTARLKIAMLGAGIIPQDERLSILQQLSVPGHPLRSLALEQTGLAMLEDGNTDEALKSFALVLADPNVLPGARQRATQMITILGGAPTDDSDLDSVDG